jgi:uncharacterized DUF497 family protein
MRRPYIDRFVWDDWNRDHIAKHGIAPDEVESVIRLDFLTRETYKQRLQLIGPSSSDRILSVIIGSDPNEADVYYVFSARPASRAERRIYSDFHNEVPDEQEQANH